MASIEEQFLAFIEGNVGDRTTTVRSFALPVLRDTAATESDLCFIIDLCSRPDVCDDVLAQELLKLMNDSERPLVVRLGAVAALDASVECLDYEYHDQENPISKPVYDSIVRELRRLLDDGAAPASLRHFALEAWASRHTLSEEARASVIRRAWAMNDREWKLAAARCMRFLRVLKTETLQAISSEDNEIRAAGIIAAGRRGLHEAWPYVSELLMSPSTKKELLLAALDGAWNIDPDESQKLIAPLTTSDDPDIARAAGQALEMAISSCFTLDLAHENMVADGGVGLFRSGKTTLPN